jgi:hypothetical protein
MTVDISQISRLFKSIHPFCKMDDLGVDLIAGQFSSKTYTGGEIIYEAGAGSTYLYIIMSGCVGFERWNEHHDRKEIQGDLESGSFFGFEMWDEYQPRLVKATAIENTTLLQIGWEKLDELCESMPLLSEFIEMMVDSYYLGLRIYPDWRDPKEPLVVVVRRHAIMMWLKILPVLAGGVVLTLFFLYLYFFAFANTLVFLILAAVIAVAAAGVIYWLYIDWDNDYFAVTNKRVVSAQKIILLYESRQESPLDAVLSVSANTNYLGRLLSYGNVVMKTYTGILSFDNIPNPEHIASIIEEKQKRISTSNVQLEKTARINTVRDRLGFTSAPPAAKKDNEENIPQNIKPGVLPKWLANLFNMRVVNEDTITYRTHWFIFLQSSWMPTLILAGTILGAIIHIIYPFTPLDRLTSLFASLFIIFASGLWWLYNYIDWRNDRYLLSDEQIVDINHKPLSSEEKRSAALNNIQSVEYQRIGLLGLVLDYGTVLIRIGDDQFTFDDVYNPSDVQREIFQRVEKQKQKQKQAEVEGERRRILDWIEAYHLVVEQEKTKDED